MTPVPPVGPLPEGQARDALVGEVTRVLEAVIADADVVVAVSGGPDSTALAFLTAEARPDLRLTLVHVRHGLRDDDAADLAAVSSHAAWLGTPLALELVSVANQGEGIEAAARRQRYAALRRRAAEVGAAYILVGHTAEDQAETVLLRLARGTGITGLAGMSAVRDDVVRPLLRVRRGDVHRFVAEEGLPSVLDPTNRDPAIRRVRAREQVLPALAGLGPDPVAALARIADLAREDAARLDADARGHAERLLRPYGPGVAVTLDDLFALDPAYIRRVVRSLVVTARGGGYPPSSAEVAAVLDACPTGAVDLPGASVSAGGGWLAAVPARATPDDGAAGEVRLDAPGRVAWPPAGLEVVAAVPGEDPAAREGTQLALGLEGCWETPVTLPHRDLVPPGGHPGRGVLLLGGRIPPAAQLIVRSRRPGDRVVTPGGTRKLQDVLVDAGVPRVLRDLVPVVVLRVERAAGALRGRQASATGSAASDRVVWVPGVAADHELAAGTGEPAVIRLTVEPDPSAV